MIQPASKSLRIGAWCVHPATGEMERDGEKTRLDARTLRLLLCLAERPGEIVSIDDLLDQVWAGVAVSPDSVYQAVASLRRLLGDDPKQPAYIATVPRLGYRMVATVSPLTDSVPNGPLPNDDTAARLKIEDSRKTSDPVSVANAHPVPRRGTVFWAVVGALCAAVVLGLVFFATSPRANTSARPAAVPIPAQNSVAVLPFLDLTEGMKEEEFADGMTEELIDKLSRIPGLHVPSPTSSFYYKGKQVPVADIAKTLGVVYVLDGSVRKSGARLRVAARLVRADNGYVAWSETYDRPFDDRLMIQDEIAGKVAKALQVSIAGASDERKTP